MRLLLVGVFLFIAFLTNPGEEEHREAAHIKAEENDISMKDKTITVKDYWICSLTSSVEKEQQKIIGAGAFTQVFIFREP